MVSHQNDDDSKNSPPSKPFPSLDLPDEKLAKLRADILAGWPKPMWKDGYQCVDAGTANAMSAIMLDLIIELQEYRAFPGAATQPQPPAQPTETTATGDGCSTRVRAKRDRRDLPAFLRRLGSAISSQGRERSGRKIHLAAHTIEQLQGEVESKNLALRNVRALAARAIRHDYIWAPRARDLIRYCDEAGVSGRIYTREGSADGTD